jgi:maleylpyruvate isomerase
MEDRDTFVAGVQRAHRTLFAVLATLTDSDVRRQSLLPGWTVGHTLTHVARNAEGQQRMVDAAAVGDVAEMYPGGLQRRQADIAAGALRPAADIADDVVAAGESLEAAWFRLDETGWAGTGLTVFGEAPVRELPFVRWREVVVHHADLGLDMGWEHWPADYVRLELVRQTMQWASRRPMGLTALPPEALAVDEHRRVAWLLGRADIPGLGRADES